MAEISTSRLRELLAHSVGHTPWYWKTFPSPSTASGGPFVWTHHGDQGPLGYLVSLGLEQEPDKPRLALNTYCRPFLVPPSSLGIWCPEGRSLRLTCFDLDQLKAFDFAEIAGWFKPSEESISKIATAGYTDRTMQAAGCAVKTRSASLSDGTAASTSGDRGGRSTA